MQVGHHPASPCLVVGEGIPGCVPPPGQPMQVPPQCPGAAGVWGGCSTGCLCGESRCWVRVLCPGGSMPLCSPWSLQLSLG